MLDLPSLQRQQYVDVQDREDAAFARILAYYQDALAKSLDRWGDVNRLLADRIRRGQSGVIALAAERDRIEAFVTELRDILLIAGDKSRTEITTLRDRLIDFGNNHAIALMDNGAEAAGVKFGFNRVNLSVVQAVVASLDDRSPLPALLDSVADNGAAIIGNAISQGVIVGKNPRAVAADINKAVDISASRSLRIARTESLRGYRAAAQQNYVDNARYLSGWRRISALNRNTCPMCLAMHGSLHPLSELFGSHPNCRCTAVPAVIGDNRPIITGPDWFAAQTKADQLYILGSKGWDMYRQGTPLSAWVRETRDPKWGLQRSSATPAN